KFAALADEPWHAAVEAAPGSPTLRLFRGEGPCDEGIAETALRPLLGSGRFVTTIPDSALHYGSKRLLRFCPLSYPNGAPRHAPSHEWTARSAHRTQLHRLSSRGRQAAGKKNLNCS